MVWLTGINPPGSTALRVWVPGLRPRAMPAFRPSLPCRNLVMRAALAALAVALAGCDLHMPWSDRGKQNELLLPGTVDARQVDVSFQVGGRISRLDTDEGKPVKAGDTIAELDPRDLSLALARARAQAASAEKALAALEAGSRVQDIRAGEAAVRQAQADLELARTQRDRTAKLVQDHFAPPQQLDTANDQLHVATAKADQAQQNLSLLREGARKEDIERASADLEAARALAATAEQQLAYAQLASPVDGVVSVRLAEQGQNVAPGQAVFRIAELDRPWVRIYLSEQDLARVKLGQAASVTADGVPGKAFHGRLSFISPEAEFTPKTVETRALRVDLVYRAKVDVDDAGGALKIGMPADVRISIAQ